MKKKYQGFLDKLYPQGEESKAVSRRVYLESLVELYSGFGKYFTAPEAILDKFFKLLS